MYAESLAWSHTCFPFIHPAEKKIMRQTLEMGGSVIRLTDCGFEDRFKPRGKDFEICSEGRLLLMAPWPQNVGRKSTAGYKEFNTMNDLAAAIASMPFRNSPHPEKIVFAEA